MRVRFAPSPTGALHIGGARTALFNWLLARGQGGSLVLRIEDTDRERSTDANVDQIIDALEWLGIDWDEGPISQRGLEDRHREVIAKLESDGRGYRSTATADDVREWKDRHGADRGFRGVAGGDGAIRLRVPDEGETVVRDAIRGDAVFVHRHLDDPVIARADGSPLYNLAVAVDDLDEGITHVVRGEDHLSNTPKQVLVLEALGAEPPVYAHLPLLHGPDGRKLSKRHGAASVQELRDAGFLPEAVLNYIALLGAGYDPEREIFTVAELQERFRLERVSRSPAVFDERKLRHINGRYVRDLDSAELASRLESFTGQPGLTTAAAIAQEKIQVLADFEPLCGFLWGEPVDDGKAFSKTFARAGSREALEAAAGALGAITGEFEVGSVEQALAPLPERLEMAPGKVYQPLRVAITGTTVSPGIFESVAALGRERTLERVSATLAKLDADHVST